MKPKAGSTIIVIYFIIQIQNFGLPKKQSACLIKLSLQSLYPVRRSDKCVPGLIKVSSARPSVANVNDVA